LTRDRKEAKLQSKSGNGRDLQKKKTEARGKDESTWPKNGQINNNNLSI